MISRNEVVTKLRQYQLDRKLVSFSVTGEPGAYSVQVGAIGKDENRESMQKELKKQLGVEVKCSCQGGLYYFMGRELRPGSGILRMVNGTPRGPGGTLTCLLSSPDGRDIYFAAAGHVLTNFWERLSESDQVSIYRNSRGFPGTNSRRDLGEPIEATSIPYDARESDQGAEVDIGIVRLRGDFDLKQRTTCYGSLGERKDGENDVLVKDQEVAKCGAEEPHDTEARVDETQVDEVLVYGPKGIPYRFVKQVSLTLPIPPTAQEASFTSRARLESFAVPGDSGTLVVDRDSRKPLGMLIAGSVLDGKYVMTPFSAMEKFWREKSLVFMRA